jgi:hypothetical protein
MKQRRFVRVLAGFAIGIVVALATLEGLLRLLPIQDGIHAADPDDRWPVHHMDPHADVHWSAGWNLTNPVEDRTNNLGYVAPFDYASGARIVAVLGDSYVESLMNPYESTLQAQLERLLGGTIPVYNFGIGGSSLPDYLGLATLLKREFVVERLVVVVGEGDFVEGFRPQPGHFFWSPRGNGLVELQPEAVRDALKKWLRGLALFRYVRGNLRISVNALFKSHPDTDGPECVATELLGGDAELIRSFVDALPIAYGLPPEKVVLLFDSESARRTMYDPRFARRDAVACPTRDSLALELLALEAGRAGVQFVHLSPAFRRHFATTGERVDHSPDDWHWNAAGHRIAAVAAFSTMGASGNSSHTAPQSLLRR